MQIRRKLCFLRNVLYISVILLLLLGIMFLYTDYSAQIPFKLVLDVLIIQLVLFRIFAFRVRIDIQCVNGNIAYNNEEIDFVMFLNKRAFYPYKRVEYTIRYKNQYDEKYQTKKVKSELSEKKCQNAVEKLGFLKCGFNEVIIEDIVIYDMFGLASASLNRRMKQEDRHKCLIVLPAVVDVEIDEGNLLNLNHDEAEDYFGENGADNSFDNYEIRRFMAGDKLNKIHWKLSTKTDELMVRDSRYETDSMIYVFFDLCQSSDMDEEFGKKTSVCAKLLNMGYPVYMTWFEYSSRIGDYVRKRRFVNNVKRLEEGVIELMKCPRYSREDKVTMGTIGGY